MLFDTKTLLIALAVLLALHILAATIFSNVIRDAEKITDEQRKMLKSVNYASPFMAYILLKMYQREFTRDKK